MLENKKLRILNRGSQIAVVMADRDLPFDSCNLLHPVLRVSPSFGDGIRPFVEGSIDGWHHWCDVSSAEKTVRDIDIEPARAADQRIMRCWVEWGDWPPSFMPNCTALLEVRGLGRRPANAVLASATTTVRARGGILDPLSISWATDGENAYPEYLIHLRATEAESGDLVLRRTLHALPPPTALPYRLDEVLWVPTGPFCATDTDKRPDVDGAESGSEMPPKSEASLRLGISRRGFGIELETVQLPPATSAGMFTKQAEMESIILQLREEARPDVEAFEPEEWEQLLKWSVGHDPQVENSTPQARLHLYRLWTALGPEKLRQSSTVRDIVLGGDLQLCEAVPELGRVSLASPEYKSPAPPNELYYQFPSDPKHCAAERQIRKMLDCVLKHPNGPSPILCPTLSSIGQSASSIHVHVNVRNELAWPRIELTPEDDFASTRALLAVVVNWIRFDGVVRTFCKPWMWRDRSLAPMFATGPEFVWPEVAWTQGTNVFPRDKATDIKTYNVPAFFRHAFQTYRMGLEVDLDSPEMPAECMSKRKESPRAQCKTNDVSAETSVDHVEWHEVGDMDALFGVEDSFDAVDKDKITPSPLLFDRVFDHDTVHGTLYRNCSLNLVALHKYGTVEFRRMHATIESDFVVAWTRFCVAFVELFGSDFDRFGRHYFDDAQDWECGLERLQLAQQEATLDDLVAIMATTNGGLLDSSVFAVLRGDKESVKI